MNDIANTLQIPTMFNQAAPPTPMATPVNHSTKWAKLTYPPLPPIIQPLDTPLIICPERCLPLKYPPQFCYYTDGSFKPPKETSRGHWKREKMGYGIYNPFKDLKIAKDYQDYKTYYEQK
jgi:hypothetical protein